MTKASTILDQARRALGAEARAGGGITDEVWPYFEAAAIEDTLRDVRIRNDQRFYRVLSYRARLKQMGYTHPAPGAVKVPRLNRPVRYYLANNRAEKWIRRAVPTEWDRARLREAMATINQWQHFTARVIRTEHGAAVGYFPTPFTPAIYYSTPDGIFRNGELISRHMHELSKGDCYMHDFDASTRPRRRPWYRRLLLWLTAPPPARRMPRRWW